MQTWKLINGFENYEVSDDGLVRNVKTKRILKEDIKKKRSRYSYALVYLYNHGKRRITSVHRLVAEAFIPNPQNLPQINHKDENSLNNKVENLEWCTAKYNINYGTLPQRRNVPNWKGRHHTLESKQKMSLAKKGKPSNQRIEITINGVTYPSIKNAMQSLHLSQRKFYKMFREKKEGN